MMDRLDFEESALKSVDMSLSPSVADFRSESPASESKKAPSNVRTILSRISYVCWSAKQRLLSISSIFTFLLRGSFGAKRVC